jgi:hypothetical protein
MVKPELWQWLAESTMIAPWTDFSTVLRFRLRMRRLLTKEATARKERVAIN